MKKWFVLALALLLALAGYIGAGPYLAISAIGAAIREQDANALSRRIDFPALRASLKPQLNEHLLHGVGIDRHSGLLGGIGAHIASGIVDTTVEAVVTPYGLAAVIAGRKHWNRIAAGAAANLPPATAAEPAPNPWRDAEKRYHSPSRFSVTVRDDDGRPVVFILTRAGLTWKLSDIRIPAPAETQ